MASARLLSIPGRLVLVGKRPDGDSIRFVPDSPAGLRRLDGAERLRPSGDGSVQLRFEGIDAPETHYGRYAQPLGTGARDRLLALAGFGAVTLDASGTVTGASPTTRVATVLSKAVEANGRPVAYVFVGERRPGRAGLTDRERGFEGTLAEWLRATPPGARPRDDGVIVGRRRTRLSALVGQEGDRVSFSADLLDLVFVENPPLSRSVPRKK